MTSCLPACLVSVVRPPFDIYIYIYYGPGPHWGTLRKVLLLRIVAEFIWLAVLVVYVLFEFSK